MPVKSVNFLFAGILSEGSHIKNRLERVIDEEIGEDLQKAFEDVEDELEDALEELEEDLENAFEDMEDLSDEEKAGKVGKAAGRALKEFVEELEDTTEIEK